MKFLSFETVLLLTLTFAKCVGNFHALSAYSSLMLLRLRPNAQSLPKAIPTSNMSMMFEFLSSSVDFRGAEEVAFLVPWRVWRT